MAKVAANNTPLVDIEKELIDTPIRSLDLSAETWIALRRSGFETVGDVLDVLTHDEEAVMSIRKFSKTLDELRDKMREKGFLNDD